MKWIQQVLLKIQSGHDSVHRRTDRRTDGRTEEVKPVYTFQLRWNRGYNDYDDDDDDGDDDNDKRNHHPRKM